MATASRLRWALLLLASSGVLTGLAVRCSASRMADQTLFYHSLHFNGGTLAAQQVESIDLSSGRKRVVSERGICSEISYAVDPSGRLLTACLYDGGFTEDAFSILDSEWPRVKAALERWLDPENFDAEGEQRSPLRVERDTRGD